MKLIDLLIQHKFITVEHPKLGVFTLQFHDYQELIDSFENKVLTKKYLFDDNWQYRSDK